MLSLEPDKKTGTIKLLSPAQWLGEATAEDSVMIQKCGCDLLLECSGYVIVHMLSKMWAGLLTQINVATVMSPIDLQYSVFILAGLAFWEQTSHELHVLISKT